MLPLRAASVPTVYHLPDNTGVGHHSGIQYRRLHLEPQRQLPSEPGTVRRIPVAGNSQNLVTQPRLHRLIPKMHVPLPRSFVGPTPDVVTTAT